MSKVIDAVPMIEKREREADELCELRLRLLGRSLPQATRDQLKRRYNELLLKLVPANKA